MEKTWMFAIKYFEENIPVSLIYFIRQDKMLSGLYQNTSLQTAHPTELWVHPSNLPFHTWARS